MSADKSADFFQLSIKPTYTVVNIQHMADEEKLVAVGGLMLFSLITATAIFLRERHRKRKRA